MTEEALPQIEWDFDKVPDSELVACCYWEYARESDFIRRVRERCLENCRAAAQWDMHLNVDLRKLQEIGYPAEVFMRGFFFEPNVEHQSQSEKMAKPRHPPAPKITGSFPAPWQSLSEVERKCRAHIRSDITRLQIVPVKMAHWTFAKDIARHCQSVAQGQYAQRMNWEAKYLRRDEKGNSFTLPDAPEPPQVESVRPHIWWGECETLMVDIAWDYFTNDEITNYFRKWVKRARPKENPNPDGKGRNTLGEWRAKLTRLAVMRLLAHFTPLAIIDPGRNSFPGVWKTKQFSDAKWAEAAQWHVARLKSEQFFRRIFPFLPPNEKPLSWERQKPDE